MSSFRMSAAAGREIARPGMWPVLLMLATMWLAVSWAVLRLEPADMALTAGAVVLFAAVSEGVRAATGSRTWWLNAGLALLFAVTGGVILADRTGSLTTPAALVGWYLLVRGAVDVATARLSRATDAVWPVLLGLGVAQAALGFWASSSLSRTPDQLFMIVAGLGLARGVADLVTALTIRPEPDEATARHASAAGYAAGTADYAASTRSGRARHRAPAERADADAAEMTAELDAATLVAMGAPFAPMGPMPAVVPVAPSSPAPAPGSATLTSQAPRTGAGAGATTITTDAGPGSGESPTNGQHAASAQHPSRVPTLESDSGEAATTMVTGGEAATTMVTGAAAGAPATSAQDVREASARQPATGMAVRIARVLGKGGRRRAR